MHPGDRVALLSESRVEWTLTDAGSIFAGTIDVPIYPTLTPPQVRYILNDSGASVLFLANREKFDELKDALGECPQVKHVIFFDAEGITAAEGLTLAQLEEKGRELEQREPGHIDQSVLKTTPDDLATIIYTSGTTGEPKGVMLTHSNLVSNLIDSSGHLVFWRTRHRAFCVAVVTRFRAPGDVHVSASGHGSLLCGVVANDWSKPP